MQKKRISDSLQIRNLTIKNRICVPPMVCFSYNTSLEDLVSEKNIEHYRAIAKGGAGLIIQEATCVSKNGKLAPGQLGIWDDKHIEGLKEITKAVHAEECKIFLQIHHAGLVGIDEPLCPSAYRLKNKNGDMFTGKEITIQEIREIQQNFIRAAKRALLAGFDGVELHGCHGYLISQFLNRRVNTRQDDYGRNPLKFVSEILDGIRKETNDDFVVGIRLGGFEPDLEAGICHAKELEKMRIDFIDVSYGFLEEMDIYVPDDFKYKDTIYAAGEIKNAVSVPVFAVNEIRTPEDAIGVLAVTDVDMIDIGRSILVDANWANKALAGEVTGKCLGCIKCLWLEDAEKCAGRRLMARLENR